MGWSTKWIAVATVATTAGMVIPFGCEPSRQRPVGATPLGAGGSGAPYVGALQAAGTGSGGAGGVENVLTDPAAPCDGGIDVDTSDPFEAAAALGICTLAVGDDWGLIDARWAMADGSTAIADADYELGHGVVRKFGANIEPQEGERLLLLSSGTARNPGQAGYRAVAGFDKDYVSASPSGYPKESPSCPGVTTGDTRDDVALELTMRSPPGATAMAFDFNFFTYEWPTYVCSTFNDFFLALLSPRPEGQTDANVSFDSMGNVVSVNNALVRVCGCVGGPPCDAPPGQGILSYDCDEGTDELVGTGFEGRAATSWLVTTAPVEPEEVVTLRYTVYDSADGLLDSTVVLDNFRWRGDVLDGPVTDPK